MRFKTLSLALPLILLIGSTAVAQNQPAPDDQSQSEVTFYVMGDVPYKPAEDVLLPQQIAAVPSDAQFVIHVGDIKGGAAPCNEAVFQKVAGMLSQSKTPVFIIPGDNEWNDCANPDQAWKLWEQYFMRFDRRWQHRLPVIRQWEHEENFSFVKGSTLFVGLNIVGGRVHDAAEWKQRHAADLDWVHRNLRRFGAEVSSLVILGHAKPIRIHNDFFDPFSKEALQFQKPILYIHGDGHAWIYDRPFAAKNILRVEVDSGGIAPPLKVTVTGDKNNPFQFDRRNGKPAQ
tara:strand:- start:6161 stop:7024 length:864 start_codon:yes stop_codon:yes gene_type:complete